MRVVCSLCSLFALVLCASAARADDPLAPGLNWVRLPGAETCIAARALAEQIELRLGRVLFVPLSAAGLTVDGSVQRVQPDGWQVVLDVSDAAGRLLGRRELRFASGDCSVIDESVVLVIAVTLYPETGLVDGGIPLDPETARKLEALFGGEPTDPDPASLGPSPTLAVGSARVPPPPTAMPPARSAERSRSHNAPGVRLGFDATASAGLGRLPGLRTAVAGYVRIAPGAFGTLELGATWWPEVEVDAGELAAAARLELLVASLALCPWRPDALPALALCFGAEAGVLAVQPLAFAFAVEAARDPVAAVLGRVLLRPALVGPLHLRAAIELSLPLLQRSYTYQGSDGQPRDLFRMPSSPRAPSSASASSSDGAFFAAAKTKPSLASDPSR